MGFVVAYFFSLVYTEEVYLYIVVLRIQEFMLSKDEKL